MTATLADTVATRTRAPNPRVILAGLMTVMGLAVIDSNIVNTALPRIVSDLGGMSRMAWTITAFLLASTIAAPLYGKLSDLYGRRRLIIVSIAIFLFGSVLCGAASSMPRLILFRAVQGLGAGGLVTLVQASIGDLAGPSERARYQAMFTTLFAVCSLVGPLLGGALTTYLSWRWVFLVNIPIGAVALALIAWGMPSTQARRRHEIDYLGAALLASFTTALLLALGTGFAGAASGNVALLVVAAVGFVLFILRERRAPEPLLDLALFTNRTFAIGVCATATMSFALLAALVLLPLYLQLVVGQTPLQAAMIVTPQIAGMILSSFVAARLAPGPDRVARFLLAGVLSQATGLWSLVIGTGLSAPVWAFSCTAFVLGAGMGVGMPNAITVVQNAVRRDQLGVVTGAISFFRSLGGAAGVALSGSVVASMLRVGLQGEHFAVGVHALIEQGGEAMARLSPTEHARYVDVYRRAIQAGFGLCAVVITAALGSVLLLPAVLGNSVRSTSA